MKVKIYKNSIKTIKHGDPKFIISDGMIISPRAGFEINQGCPQEYKTIISECIDRGWLKPVAYMTEKELIFMGLSNV